VDKRRKEAKPDFAAWVTNAAASEFDKDLNISNLVVHVPLNQIDSNQVAVAVGAVTGAKLGEAPEWQDGELGPVLVLKTNTTLNLGDAGDFEKDAGFSSGAWVRVSKAADAGILA